MDKKQKISWGVSFSSLALVAGMVSYLGLSNNDKTNNHSSQQNRQQSQDGAGLPSSQGDSFNQTFGSQINPNDGSNFDNSTGTNDQQDQFSTDGSLSAHHRGFDTTTGGT